jgi:hypothetical protein
MLKGVSAGGAPRKIVQGSDDRGSTTAGEVRNKMTRNSVDINQGPYESFIL